jgi:hypothetical protein
MYSTTGQYPKTRPRRDRMKANHTTQLILPSGQIIELIYVAQGDEPGDDITRMLESLPDADLVGGCEEATLHCCDACGSELVYPVWWEEVDDETWAVERRCPSCEWRHIGEFRQGAVDHFNNVRTDGMGELLRALRETARTNMAHDVDRLVGAIHDGLIQPMDF